MQEHSQGRYALWLVLLDYDEPPLGNKGWKVLEYFRTFLTLHHIFLVVRETLQQFIHIFAYLCH